MASRTRPAEALGTRLSPADGGRRVAVPDRFDRSRESVYPLAQQAEVVFRSFVSGRVVPRRVKDIISLHPGHGLGHA